MTARRQWAAVLAVVGALALVLWGATRMLGDELFPVGIGSEAPDFRAVTVDGTAREKSLADYRDSVVLLNIWATWCAPCREEMPSIQALHERYAAHGLKVVAVSIDDAGAEAAIRDFAREFGLTFEILHDASGDIRTAYQTTGVPETFVIGRDGVIRRKQIGHSDWDSPANRRTVATLLGVAADTADAAPAPGAPGAGGDSARSTPMPAGAPGAVPPARGSR